MLRRGGFKLFCARSFAQVAAMLVRSTPDSKPAYCVEDLFVTNRTKYPTIAERFPGVPSGVALGKVLWDIYVKHTLPKAPLVTSGEFNFKRHFLNRRRG